MRSRRRRQLEIQLAVIALSVCCVALWSVAAVQAGYAKRLQAGARTLSTPRAAVESID